MLISNGTIGNVEEEIKPDDPINLKCDNNYNKVPNTDITCVSNKIYNPETFDCIGGYFLCSTSGYLYFSLSLCFSLYQRMSLSITRNSTSFYCTILLYYILKAQ